MEEMATTRGDTAGRDPAAQGMRNQNIVVVHGVGQDTRRGDLLAKVVNLVADSLLESAVICRDETIYPVITREMDVTGETPTAKLHITAPGGEQPVTWTFKEAFWDDKFPPPPPSAVLRWLGIQMRSQLDSIRHGLLKDPDNSRTFYEPDRPPEDVPVEESRRVGRFDAAVFWLQHLALAAAVLLVFPVLWAAFCAFWLLYWVPRIGPLEQPLKGLERIDPFLSYVLGDAQRYVEDGVWAASARGVLEDIVIRWLIAPDDGETGGITIVAHSLGCLIAYDALADGGRIAAAVGRQSATGQRKKITFVSVGSAITRLLPVAQGTGSSLQARERFDRALDPVITGFAGGDVDCPPRVREQFYWLDIHADMDPVPGGALPDKIVTKAGVYPCQVKRRRVSNLMNPVRDHSYYWCNRSEVGPRIARAINGGDYPWPEAGITKEKLEDHYGGLKGLIKLRYVVGALFV